VNGDGSRLPGQSPTMRLENERIGSGKARVDGDSPVVILNIALQASHSFANGSSALSPIDSQKVQLKAQEGFFEWLNFYAPCGGMRVFRLRIIAPATK